jgi:hypothetical protein
MQILTTPSPTQQDIVGILQVDNFHYPLVKSIPCLRVNSAYIFPLSPEISYGIVLDPNIPQAYMNLVDSTLKHCVDFQSEDLQSAENKKKSETFGKKIGNKIEEGSVFLSGGISTTASYIQSVIENSVPAVKLYVTPSKETVIVHPSVTNTLQYVGSMTPYAVWISRAAYTAIAKAAKEVGTRVVDYAVTSPLTQRISPQQGGVVRGVANSAAEIGHSSLYAIATVWGSLEAAACQLLTSTSVATVTIVEHKYGKDAAVVTEKGLGITGDLVKTYYNVNMLGPKNLVKVAAKETGKQIMMEATTSYKQSQLQNNESTTAEQLQLKLQ